jgi:aryl-alcohol dehydrogenase-like predicted oxidoreductase
MRLSTDDDRDEQRALATVAAAVEAGTMVFDTARAYGRGEHELGLDLILDGLERLRDSA